MESAREELHDPQLEATIGAMETAFRMQTEAPDVFDVRKESQATIKMYGEGSTARGCLTAARLIERGVRMVQIYYAKGDPWDHHFDIEMHRKTGRDSDQPFAALIKDLKARGLFDETIIVPARNSVALPSSKSVAPSWAARHTTAGITIHTGSRCGSRAAGSKVVYLRRHRRFRLEGDRKSGARPRHPRDNSLSTRNRPHQATYHYSGRDYRLTDLAGNVIHDLIA